VARPPCDRHWVTARRPSTPKRSASSPPATLPQDPVRSRQPGQPRHPEHVRQPEQVRSGQSGQLRRAHEAWLAMAGRLGAALQGRSPASRNQGQPRTSERSPKARQAPGGRWSAAHRWSRLSTCSPRDADPGEPHGPKKGLPLPAWERDRRSPVSSSAPAWAQAARHRAARRPARPRRAGTRRRLAVSGPRMKPRREPGPAPRAERRDAALHGRPCAGRGRLARLRSTTSGSSHQSLGRCKCPRLPCWSAPAHGQARRRGFSWATGGSVLSDRGAAQRSGFRAWRGLTFSHNAGDSCTRARILGPSP
jgi:hypothetical protein